MSWKKTYFEKLASQLRVQQLHFLVFFVLRKINQQKRKEKKKKKKAKDGKKEQEKNGKIHF